MAKTGLSYYQAETDRFQDIKVKRLKKRYGCEGYAVYQYIQNEIYRVEGCYIRFTDDQLFDVSEYWGIDEQRVERIIEYCMEVELFDAITWHTNRVLTSADIQQRYLEICRRAKKKIVIPEDIRLVETRDAPSGTDSALLPLFTGQEIETKTGKAVYGSPKLDTGKQTAVGIGELTAIGIGAKAATDIGKQAVITAGVSSGTPSTFGNSDISNNSSTSGNSGISSYSGTPGTIIPQSSAEIRETPQNSAEKRHKEKESKENSPSIPQAIRQTRDEEDNVSLSSGGNRENASAESHPLRYRHRQGAEGNGGNIPAESCGNIPVRLEDPERPECGEDYRVQLQRLGETCYNLGCSKGDIRKVLMIEAIAMDDSPIWQLIDELKASGGRYSFTGDVLPALWGLVKTGRLRMVEERTDEVKESGCNVRQMLVGAGVPSYDVDELCEEAKGKEDVLQEVIREIRRSKGRILSASCFIRSRLKKVRKNELQKTA